jgi:hypothetical protein
LKSLELKGDNGNWRRKKENKEKLKLLSIKEIAINKV